MSHSTEEHNKKMQIKQVMPMFIFMVTNCADG